ncbi:MAG: hypothetical protein IJR99_09250 [Kiritimatiellae bacterium]|nr:hypothetical protein [Kiritimatiellia bacterium]
MHKPLTLTFCAMFLSVGVTTAQTQQQQPAATPPADAKPAPAVEELEKDNGLRLDAGADLRVRQEMADNIPGHPGDPLSPYPTASGKNQNWIRYRPRVWGKAEYGDFGVYVRLADEMREYIVKNHKRRDDRSYNFPDELIVDNLYFEGKGLFNDFLDFRIGRQDFLDGGAPAYGAGRTMMDGTPYDGSRTLFMDAARFILHMTDKTTLDAFAIYNNSRNELHWGRPTPDPRPMNAIDPRDEADMDEWGGGLYLKSREISDQLPFELYWIYKHDSDYHLLGNYMPARYVNTFGVRFIPQFTEELSAELEGAAQRGEKSNGTQTGGYMGYAALKYRPEWETVSPARLFFKADCYYLSGDKHRGKDDNDTAWDPVWARWPQDSEMLVYGPLYGLGYWSNMVYPTLGTGADIAKHHKLNLYSGPMFAAVQDGLGGGDSNYEGWLSVARYDFPIWLNKSEGGRGEIFGHIMAECFQPGDYYESDKTAYFFRWEVVLKF